MPTPAVVNRKWVATAASGAVNLLHFEVEGLWSKGASKASLPTSAEREAAVRSSSDMTEWMSKPPKRVVSHLAQHLG